FMENDVFIRVFYSFEPDIMSYDGKYPFATLRAKKGDVHATMEVFSPIIPGNLDDSIMPAFGMSIKVDGSKGGTVSVSASNLAGSHAIGRINAPVDGGVKFINPMTNDYDVAKGE